MYHPSSYSDEELLKCLTEDDKAAFAEIYRRYWSLLLALAYNRLKNLAAAEDIVHDVYAGLWYNRHRQEIKSLKNYMATAVKYLVLKEIRKKALFHRYSESQDRNNFFVITTDNSLDTKRVLKIVKEEIETLPEKCRLIFKLSRESGLTVKQIASEMDITPKTVENQLNKALRKIKGTIRKSTMMLFSFI